MKKTAAKTQVKKTTPKAKTRTRKASASFPIITIHRFIIVSAVAVALVSVALLTHKQEMTQAVAGISIARPLFAQATISWERVPEAVSYNIYYKEEGETIFTNAARNIPVNQTNYTLKSLKKTGKYIYKVSAVDASGSEFLWSGSKSLADLQPMQ